MSLWIPRRSKNGRLEYFVVGVPLSLVIATVGICLALLVSFVVTAPVEAILFLFAIMGVGLFLIAAARASVFWRGELLSSGSVKMSPQMRRAYRAGWGLMVVGAILAVLAVAIASRIRSGI